MRRRNFLILSATSVGGALAQAQPKIIKVPLRFFKQEEALDIAAAAAQIFPADGSGPGANEAGVVIYIDRQLAGPYGRDHYRYTKGPWVESMPEHGYQGKATPRDVYRAGIRGLGNFADLPMAE